MKRMDYREGSEMLRKVGFTASEIEHLSKLRSSYSDQEIQMQRCRIVGILWKKISLRWPGPSGIIFP